MTGDHTKVTGTVQAKATPFALDGRHIAHENDNVFLPGVQGHRQGSIRRRATANDRAGRSPRRIE